MTPRRARTAAGPFHLVNQTRKGPSSARLYVVAAAVRGFMTRRHRSLTRIVVVGLEVLPG